jgi:hypothetical protein
MLVEELLETVANHFGSVVAEPVAEAVELAHEVIGSANA